MLDTRDLKAQVLAGDVFIGSIKNETILGGSFSTGYVELFNSADGKVVVVHRVEYWGTTNANLRIYHADDELNNDEDGVEVPLYLGSEAGSGVTLSWGLSNTDDDGMIGGYLYQTDVLAGAVEVWVPPLPLVLAADNALRVYSYNQNSFLYAKYYYSVEDAP